MVIFATRLLKVNDAFKLREELALKIGICAFLGGEPELLGWLFSPVQIARGEQCSSYSF